MKKILKYTGIGFGSLIVILFSLAIMAGITPISLGLHHDVYHTENKALGGFDVVSYFNGNPLQGSESLTYKWEGVEWLFSSEKNLNTFKANPGKYIPQFGGYCAKAVSTGFTAPSNPSVWLVYQNKLYIFSSEDQKNEFKEDPSSMITACLKEWN